MKHLLSIVLFCTIFNIVYSQQISPVQTGEFCPNIDYTFTVSSLPKPFQSIIGNGGCFVTQQPTSPVGSTFTFKGKFGDANQKQGIRIYFTDGTFFDFEFKKIKSLFYSATSSSSQQCNIIKPNQTQPVVFPRCSISSATISFPNIQWFTNFENPEVCFGTVLDYEYLLPSGWKLGTSTSNGSTWISGTNNATVTSDLSTGDGVNIKIRASNKSCMLGLAANGPIALVRISRPEPVLSITNNNPILCSGNANYILNGLPAGATVLWTISSSLDASLTNTTSPTVTLTRNTLGNTFVTLTATITHCNFTYTINTMVTLGTGVNTVNYGMTQVTCLNKKAYYYANVTDISGATNYAWYAKDMSNASNPFVLKESAYGYNNIDFPLGPANRYYTVYVLVTTPCGTVQSNLSEGYFFAPSCVGSALRVSTAPNPAESIVNVQLLDEQGNLETEKKINILQIQVTNKLGTILLTRKVSGELKSTSLNISSLKSDSYFIKVWDGTNWRTTSFIKQ